MSNAQSRMLKWTVKTDPARVQGVLTGLRDLMTDKMAAMVPELITIETRTKQVLNENGVSIIQNPFYLAFARELWSLQRRQFAGDALTREAAILLQKWVSRGLTAAVLEQIREQVLTIPTPTPGP